MNVESRAGNSAERLDSGTIFTSYLNQNPGGGNGGVRRFLHSLSEKQKPNFPVSLVSNLEKQLVVFGASLFEVEAEVEERFSKDAF